MCAWVHLWVLVLVSVSVRWRVLWKFERLVLFRDDDVHSCAVFRAGVLMMSISAHNPRLMTSLPLTKVCQYSVGAGKPTREPFQKTSAKKRGTAASPCCSMLLSAHGLRCGRQRCTNDQASVTRVVRVSQRRAGRARKSAPVTKTPCNQRPNSSETLGPDGICRTQNRAAILPAQALKCFAVHSDFGLTEQRPAKRAILSVELPHFSVSGGATSNMVGRPI